MASLLFRFGTVTAGRLCPVSKQLPLTLAFRSVTTFLNYPFLKGHQLQEGNDGHLRRYYSAHTDPSVIQQEPNVISDINDQIQSEKHGRLFAVIHIVGRQFKITEEDVIALRGYWAPDIGDRLRLEKVMLVGSTDFTLVGKPLLPRDLVRIEATVIEKTMSETRMHFRMKPRRKYKRLYFYRIPYTMVRINFIKFDGLIDELKDVEGLRPATLW